MSLNCETIMISDAACKWTFLVSYMWPTKYCISWLTDTPPSKYLHYATKIQTDKKQVSTLIVYEIRFDDIALLQV